MYADPRHFETQIDAWASEHGEDVVVQFPTNSITRMFPALVRYREDMAESLTTHDDDPTYRSHALAARKVAKPGDKFILGKPSEHQRIDVLMADAIAYEARADALASGWTEHAESTMYVFD
jgi:phage terminase large subunit-like protein